MLFLGLFLGLLAICILMLLCTILLFIKACFAVANRLAGYGTAAAPRVIPVSESLIINTLICLYFISGIVFIISERPFVFYLAMIMVLISAACEACLEYLNRNLPKKLIDLIVLTAIPVAFFCKQFNYGYALLFFLIMLGIGIALCIAISKEG